MRIARPVALLLAAALWTAGCTKFVEPCKDGECTPPVDVPADTPLPDVPGDLAPDGAPDVLPGDVIDATEIPELPLDVPDEATDAIDIPDVPDVPQDVPDTLPGDVLLGGAGWPCTTDGECQNGQCVPWNATAAESPKVCTGRCIGGCPAGLQCLPAGTDGSTTCSPLPEGLCAPCRAASDCPTANAQCVEMVGGRNCTAPCGEGLPCPLGFTCTFLETPGLSDDQRRQCLPDAGGCECVADLDEVPFPCSISNGLGTCIGERTCAAGTGWSVCSARFPGPEICNGRDDDCNGQTDEGFQVADWDGAIKTLGESCGTGLCADGVVQCGAGGVAAECSSASKRQASDDCGVLGGNGIDEDCDGATDEGCGSPDRDGDGTPNDEDCSPDDAGRHPGATEPCCPNQTPAAEVAARCDYNCDGQVTFCALDDQDGDGYTPPVDCNDADPTVHPGAPEKCNDAVDQDCSNGDLNCCAPTDTGCVGPVDRDLDGFVGRFDCNDDNAEIHPGAVEMCNYVDDDCDGLIDEGSPSGFVDEARPGLGTVAGGSACGPDDGECVAGRWSCVHYPPYGRRMECVGAVGPTLDVCDGADNDCDGGTDEDFPLKDKPCDGDDLDQCQNGTWQCSADRMTLICLEPRGRTDIVEVCGNGQDEDCDGETDNGCFPDDLDGDGYAPPADCDDTRSEIHPGAKEPCCDASLTGAAALKKCDANCDGKVTACPADDQDGDSYRDKTLGGNDCNDTDPFVRPGAPEKCGDGIDQDCDTEDTPCGDIVDHDGDGFAPPADCNDSNAGVNPWAAEKCNGVDDDCDNQIDEGNPGSDGAPCGSALGQCQQGIQVCIQYATFSRLECVPKRGPLPETCNGADDNCNGRTDEAFPELGVPCDGLDADRCAHGVHVCSEDGSGVACGPESPADIPERCNGGDDDCNGLTDEGFDFHGQPIGAACEGDGECGAGLVQCSLDGLRATCSTNADGSFPQATSETCNHVDDDCDGITDDGMLYAGRAVGTLCMGAGTCGLGVVECNAALKATCSTNPDGTNPQAIPEVCDGRDNDCDGHNDEGVTASIFDCRRKGICAGATIPSTCVKGAWECDYQGVPGFEPEETLCDAVDNDCDGETDEGFAVGGPCDGPDNDQCKNGIISCKADMHGVTCGTETATDLRETCNSLDDDCDGLTDETYPVGELCDGPDTDTCKNGSFTCTSDGTAVECVNEFVVDLVEACNAVDDDCNGSTDEVFPDKGLVCDGPDDDLCANGHWACTVDGAGLECAGDEPTTPTVEVCDAMDNDCDGLTDEDFSWNGQLLGETCEGIGECGTGIVTCAVGGLAATCSTNADGPASQAVPETCDGRDDDCDGSTDEDQAWQGLPLGDPCDPPGVCGPGAVVCSPSRRVATCSTMPDGTVPDGSIEKCNGLDDDCDGPIDNFPPGETGGCKVAGLCTRDLVIASCIDGVLTCDYSQVIGYVDGPEAVCNGLDDNCDGFTDETFAVNVPCDGPDSDQCTNGLMQCNAEGNGIVCGTESASDLVETCGDAVDNDCNGLTDEEGAAGCLEFYRNADGDAYGVSGDRKCLCTRGQIEPWNGSVGGDCDDTNPLVYPGSFEICNGLDDDCDSTTDEDFPDKGTRCDGGDADQCANGTLTCTADGLGLECTGDYTSTEACNGVDDDCDGSTDEDFPLGQSCDGGDGDQCKNGTFTCTADGSGVECATETAVDIVETCNGKDDDCDGLTDEDFPDKGKTCDGADSDMCKQGTFTCKGDGTGVDCVNEPAPPSPSTTEMCDNLDNDCNGLTDDPWPAKNQKCDTNPSSPIPCETGLLVCNGAKTDITCIGHTDCADKATCQLSGDPYLQDECVCGATPGCTADIASTCSPSFECKCGFNAACTGGKKCVFNGANYVCQ